MGRRRRLMLPRVNESLSPPFHEMTEYPFQDLCCELFSRQEGIATCEVYGRRGQKQRGIDLWAHCVGGNSSEVGQCKCYKEFSHREIEKASDGFFAHLGYWRERRVQRFILFVACDLDDVQQQEEIHRQLVRFAEHKIRYEAWSAQTLRSKLGPYRDIVARHLKAEYWIEHICGPAIPPVPDQLSRQPNLPLTLGFVGARFERLASRLSEDTTKKLEEIREQYREGRKREAFLRLQELPQDQEWDVLEKSLRARILRVLGTYALVLDGDANTARALSSKACELDPSGDDTTIRSLLRYRAEGAEAAIQELSLVKDVDVLNLRAAFLLELGRTTDALSLLACLPEGIVPNAETKRLQALISLTEGDLMGAQQRIQQAFTERPQWEAIRFTRALVDYYSALSQAVTPHHLIAWPQPVEWAFVQRDDQSVQRLRRCAAEFADLALSCDSDSEARAVYEVWRLTCLANDPDRQTEAEGFCQSLLAKDPTNHRVLAWALARNYAVDLSMSEEALEASLKEDTNGSSEEPA